MDKTKILPLVLFAAVAGILVGYRSVEVPTVPPKPLQLIQPAPSARTTSPVSLATATRVRGPITPAAVVPAPIRSGAAHPVPVPRSEVGPAAPAVFTAPHVASDTTAPAPPMAESTAPATEEYSDADDYQAQAITRMHQGEYHKASDLFEAALRHGGRARFAIVHDHSKGNFEEDSKASCVGELILSPTEIRFEGAGAGDSHHFEASWADLLDAGANKFFGSGLGGFHIAINPDGKYKNFNFAPRSKDKFEAKLIVDLLNANARKADRGK